MIKPRVVWLLTSSKYYWHSTLGEMANLFPGLTVFAPNWPGYALGFEDSFAVETFSKPKIIPLKPSETGYGLNFTYLPFNMIRRLLRVNPDLVFSNSFGIWTLLALLFKPVGRWRVVIAYEGSSPHVDYRNDPLRLALRRWMIQVADACITNSQAGKAYLTEILGVEASRVFSHPYQTATPKSISGNMCAADQHVAQLPHPIFLFVGKIISRKGVRQLLEACNLLQKQGHRHYSVLILGEGSQRSELEEFVTTQQISDRVKWLGSICYQDLGAYFLQSDVLILPTLEDTWGMVVLEAMVFGKPVICSRRAGSAELILQGKTGYCFDPENPAELAETMLRFINDQQLGVEMGKQSKRQMERYTPETAARFLAHVTSYVFGTETAIFSID